MGVSRYAASEFSFLLAVPMMMGATALDSSQKLGLPDKRRYPYVCRWVYHRFCGGADSD